MSLVICVSCGHPFAEHEDEGCVDLLWDEPGANAYPELCPCVLTADEVLHQVVPPSDQPPEAPPAAAERITCVDDLAGLIDYEIMAEVSRLTTERDEARAALRAAEGRKAALRAALDKLVSLIIGAHIHSNPRLLLEKSWEAAQFATMLESLLAAPDRSDLEAT
jgi:hypothetical protein